MLGFVLMWRQQLDPAIAAFDRAMALNPNYVDWRFGWPFVLAGQPQRALDLLDAYMRLDPFHGPLPLFFTGVGIAHDFSPVLRNGSPPRLVLCHYNDLLISASRSARYSAIRLRSASTSARRRAPASRSRQ